MTSPERSIAPWLLVGALLVVKAPFIARFGSSPHVWYDELFYFGAAFDLTHWGRFGVPHPQLFFYPPLLSVLIAPWHALHALGLDLPMSWLYRLSLLTASAAAASTLVFAYRLASEVLGVRSLGLALVVALSSPAYLGLLLMSESLFVPLYVAHLLFVARFLRRRRRRDALGAGALAAAMVLTRPTGIVLLGAAVGMLGVELVLGLRGRRLGRDTSLVRPLDWLWIVLPALAARLLWSPLHARWADPTNWNLPLSVYLDETWGRLMRSPAELWPLVDKMLGNLAYVGLASFGLWLPLLVFACRGSPESPSGGAGASGEHADDKAVLRLLLVYLGGFLLLVDLAAAVHMSVYGGDDPERARYDVYGRYVEAFVVPLLALGAAATLRLGEALRRLAASDAARGRRRLVLGTGVVTALAVLAIDIDVFNRLVGAERIFLMPNHQGMGWVFVAWRLLPGEGFPTWLALALVAGLVAAGLARLWLGSRAGSGTGGGTGRAVVATALPLLLGLAAVAQCQVVGSTLWGLERMVLSNPLRERPALWRDGLCVEWRRHGPRHQPAVWVAFFDLYDHALAGPCALLAPELPALGTDLPDREILLAPQQVQQTRRAALYGPASLPSPAFEVTAERLAPRRLLLRVHWSGRTPRGPRKLRARYDAVMYSIGHRGRWTETAQVRALQPVSRLHGGESVHLGMVTMQLVERPEGRRPLLEIELEAVSERWADIALERPERVLELEPLLPARGAGSGSSEAGEPVFNTTVFSDGFESGNWARWSTRRSAPERTAGER
ncbi:MAG: glycosyltransferase family 39 protein [Acidobacteriota bacterium]